MKTKAVRLYGKKDLRLEEFELPEIKENEILASVITDSICMSTWKLANQGADHKKRPIILRKIRLLLVTNFVANCWKLAANGHINIKKESGMFCRRTCNYRIVQIVPAIRILTLAAMRPTS